MILFTFTSYLIHLWLSLKIFLLKYWNLIIFFNQFTRLGIWELLLSMDLIMHIYLFAFWKIIHSIHILEILNNFFWSIFVLRNNWLLIIYVRLWVTLYVVIWVLRVKVWREWTRSWFFIIIIQRCLVSIIESHEWRLIHKWIIDIFVTSCS